MEKVDYFKKWRVQDLKKRRLLAELEAQGAERVDVAAGPPPPPVRRA